MDESDDKATDFTICPLCDRLVADVEKRCINTAFVNDSLNHQVSCRECWVLTCEYYNDLWEDFNNSRF